MHLISSEYQTTLPTTSVANLPEADTPMPVAGVEYPGTDENEKLIWDSLANFRQELLNSKDKEHKYNAQ